MAGLRLCQPMLKPTTGIDCQPDTNIRDIKNPKRVTFCVKITHWKEHRIGSVRPVFSAQFRGKYYAANAAG